MGNHTRNGHPGKSGNGKHNGHANGHAPRFTVPAPTPDPDADRLPPHNLEAERGVLGGILLDDGHAPAVLALLTDEDFYREGHQAIYRAIKAVWERLGAVDPLLLHEELVRRGEIDQVGGLEGLDLIRDGTPGAVNTLLYAQVVREKALARTLYETGNQLARDAVSDRFTAPELAASAIERIEAAGGRRYSRPEVRVTDWPEPPEPPAWQGLAGEVALMIAPHTEADPAAILIQFLAAVGNVIGRRVHWRVGATRHHLNLFCCLVGNSAKARKGTSWDHVLSVVGGCDPAWRAERVVDGLSSGEGVIWEVRDEVRNSKGQVVVDEVGDKRLLVVETEFGGTLSILTREGNTLSAILRKAWDSGNLRSLTKNSPARASGAHISVIGHITFNELQHRLAATDAANGFANRFLWVCARRSRLLPHGGQIHRVDFADVHRRLAAVLDWAREEDLCLVRDDEANAIWERSYGDLTETRSGLLGSITSRAEAQVMRLAGLYALLDCSAHIHREHLEAGLALWRYCDRSAAFIFGASLGDPDMEHLLAAIREAGPEGLSRTRISVDVFRRHKSSEEIARLLGALAGQGMICRQEIPTGGRSAEVWFCPANAPETSQ